MRIVRIDIENFRGVKSATLFPSEHNVYLGPNNIGKTTMLEALNLLLNPEFSSRSEAVSENDFYGRHYRTRKSTMPPEATSDAPAAAAAEEPVNAPVLRISAVLTDMDAEETRGMFADVVVPWDESARAVVERGELGDDPFESASHAIRPCVEAWYNEEEDDFEIASFFLRDQHETRGDAKPFTRTHKRQIGFLIYRDFRGLSRPVTLDPGGLFSRLLQSQSALPRDFEAVLEEVKGSCAHLLDDPDFRSVVNDFRLEMGRYLPITPFGAGDVSFEITSLTRRDVKEVAQLYVQDALPLPIQRMGAGTRSLALLAILLLIVRKRGRGILALEEPETFLFPHAQRRVLDEVINLKCQTFVTTHSPYVLERMPLDGYQRLVRDAEGHASARSVITDPKLMGKLRTRLKQQMAEALLGTHAIIVEEESTRLWVLRTSALLHGSVVDGMQRVALELSGVAVVDAGGCATVPAVGNLLTDAGITVLGLVDQTKPSAAKQICDDARFPVVFHREQGLEAVLATSLSRDVLEWLLVTPSDYKKRVLDAPTVRSWDEAVLREQARMFLQEHKSNLMFHEELLEHLDITTIPEPFLRFVTKALEWMAPPRPGHFSMY
jgi:putative ATP-dependent endonuclease of OLD family